MPLIGVIFYFSKSPRYIPEPIIKAKLIALTLLTIILPILLYFLLKLRKKVTSIHLLNVSERIYPLLLSTVITVIIIKRILPVTELIELHYFFICLLISTLACLILALLKYKASIHMIAAGGVLMFAIATSIHFNININGSLALFFILTGAIATSRLHMLAHTSLEIIIGFFVGFIPQLILLNYWL